MTLSLALKESKDVIDKYMDYRKHLHKSGTTHMLAIATVAFHKIKNAGDYKIEVMDLWIDSFVDFPDFLELLEIKFKDAIEDSKPNSVHK